MTALNARILHTSCLEMPLSKGDHRAQEIAQRCVHRMSDQIESNVALGGRAMGAGIISSSNENKISYNFGESEHQLQ